MASAESDIMNLIDVLDQSSLKQDIPDFRPGDTVKVHVNIVEGNRSRIQVFQGVVLGRQGVPAAIDGASTYHDKEGHAYRTYSVSVSDETQAHSACVCAFIVRPDGYIGAFVRDVDGLETYIIKIVGGAAPYR